MQVTTKSHAAERIADVLSMIADNKTLVLLSGGSSAGVAVDALSRLDVSKTQNITTILADERYLEYGASDSNATLLKSFGVEKYCHEFIQILQPSNQNIDTTTENFRQNLSKQIRKAKNIVAILGVGTNNHTAGIMPNSISVTTDEPLAINFKYTDFERITITPAVFTDIKYALLYAEGADKELAVSAIEKDLDYIEYPSQLIKKCQNWQVMYNKEKL